MTLWTKIKRTPVLGMFLACFWAEALMNTLFGWNRGGALEGGPRAVIYATIFGVLAYIGKWSAEELFSIRGWSELQHAKRGAFLLLLVPCVIVAQVSGWAVIGTLLADGGIMRKVAATGHSIATNALETASKERAALGAQPAPKQVEAQIQAALDTYIPKLKATANSLSNGCKQPDGAPSICKQVADLRKKLADAERAAELDTQLPDLNAKLASAPMVAEGNPDTDVFRRIFGGDTRGVEFGWTVFLTGLVTFCGLFGPAYVKASTGDYGSGYPQTNGTGGGQPLPQPHSDRPWTYPAGPPRLAAPEPPPRYERPTQEHAYPSAPVGAPGFGTGMGLPVLSPSGGTLHGGSPISHGAPVNIHIGAVPGVTAAPMAALSLPPASPGAAPHKIPDAQVEVILPGAFAPMAPDRPSDSQILTQALHGLLTFKAAALEDCQGSIVPLGTVYERYTEWAGPRAMDILAFRSLLTAATGVYVVDMGGLPHYVGVALRSRPGLAAVA